MCLHTIQKVYDPPLEEERTAWKVGSLDPEGEFITEFDRFAYPFNTWLYAEVSDSDAFSGVLTPDRTHISNHVGGIYPLGFHCYTDRETALRIGKYREYDGEDTAVVEVRIKAIVAEGLAFNGRPVVVAQELMFVRTLEEEERTQPACKPLR